MERDEHLALLGVAHALNRADKTRSLRHEQLLVVMRVIIGREHDHDRPTETTVDVVGNDAFKNRALEDPVETALILIEVIRTHRVCLGCGLRLCWNWLAGRCALGHLCCGRTLWSFCSRYRRDHSGGDRSRARMLKVNRHRPAVDGILFLLLTRQGFLFGFGLGF